MFNNENDEAKSMQRYKLTLCVKNVYKLIRRARIIKV